MLRSFGFSDFKVYLATRPGEKFVGDEAMWSEATRALRESVERAGIDYEVDEGGGAFYGPKIDIKIKDALGREWQCSTIQFDFNMPERFDVTYVGSDGQKHRPYMIHRALLGSIERFVGVLVEHYAGRFPMWLSPVQLVLINVVSDAAERTARLRDEFAARGLRVESDLREETIGYKVRDAIEKKVPFVGVIGKKEMESGSVSVRRRGENASRTIPVDEFAALLETEAARKS